jgi:ketosteroid isomerase-like protein
MTVEQVQQEVRRFWKAFSANDARTLADFYSSHATVFNSSGELPEDGPTSAARCYFEFDFSLAVEVSDIQVQILGADAGTAVASYTLRLRRDFASSLSGHGAHQAEDDAEEALIEHGRVTQVFARNADGAINIVHEHLSLPELRRWEREAGKSLLDRVQVPA